MLLAESVAVILAAAFDTVTVVVALSGRYVLSPWYCTVRVSVPAVNLPGGMLKV
jgi:hypothetical protein